MNIERMPCARKRTLIAAGLLVMLGIIALILSRSRVVKGWESDQHRAVAESLAAQLTAARIGNFKVATDLGQQDLGGCGALWRISFSAKHCAGVVSWIGTLDGGFGTPSEREVKQLLVAYQDGVERTVAQLSHEFVLSARLKLVSPREDRDGAVSYIETTLVHERRQGER